MFHDSARFIKYCVGVLAFLAALGVIGALFLGFAGKDWHWPWDTPTATTATTTGAGDAAQLTQAPERCAGYNREAFGDFTSETETYVKARARGVDGWDGQTLDGRHPQIDHIVPVHEAFCSGLPQGSWAAFYNDTDNLLLTAGKTNASKSDKEPGEWAAPTPEAQCRFVATWVAVKAKWHLTADTAELGRLAGLHDRCAQMGLSA